MNSDERIEWFPLNQPMSHYKIQLDGLRVGGIEIPGHPTRAFVDSGTTFAYLSRQQKVAVDKAIQDLCKSGEYACRGTRTTEFCWKFDEKKGLKNYYSSFPILEFISSKHGAIRWYPSEYFYQEKPGLYCLAIDPFGSSTEMIIGGSMMR